MLDIVLKRIVGKKERKRIVGIVVDFLKSIIHLYAYIVILFYNILYHIALYIKYIFSMRNTIFYIRHIGDQLDLIMNLATLEQAMT